VITVPIKIGLDVGGVLTDSLANDSTDTSFRGDNFMLTSAVPGSFDAARELVYRFGAENVFIISKCGDEIERKTRLWLGGKRFYTQTGFLVGNLNFCRSRPEKAPIAARLGLTDFVDDRADVLFHMRGIVERRYLFGPQPGPATESGLIITPTWRDVLHEVSLAAA
jgi:hypothetical protein